MTDILAWKPPSWWTADDTSETLANRDLRTFASDLLHGDRVSRVKSAYAKAKGCKVCHNNAWPIMSGTRVYVGSLLSSAEKGCAGCLTLCGIVNKCALISKNSRQPFELSLDQWVSCRVERSRMVLECYPDASWEVFTPQRLKNPWQIPYLPHEVVGNSGSDQAVQRVSLWLRDCEDNHELCKNARSSLPTRVVLIQGPETIKLYETNGEVEPYVCLSHCWGKGEITKTVTATLPTYKQSVPWQTLPRTFRDAISLAFRLGYKYLWIDSLCIIQDSVEDWRSEGSRMAQIYSGADLTIAATASSDPSEGCFRQTTERPIDIYSYPDINGSMLDACVRTSINHYAWRYGEYPLLRRGWTMQECLLSRRVVHFTTEEMFWACRTVNECECSFWWDDGKLPFKNLRSPKYLTTIRSSNEMDCTVLWHRIVSEYTRSSLTYETDCFPALQGVSKHLHQLKRSAYMAGLWENSIMYDLLWYSDYNDKTYRPQEWRAPSWSWASVVGRVIWPNWMSICTPLSTYIAKEISLAGTDEFGELKSGKITLRGRCLLETMEGTYQYNAEPCANIEYPDHRAWRKCLRKIYLDSELEGAGSKMPRTTINIPVQRVKTLLMGVYQLGFKPKYLYAALVLQPLDTAAHTYKRIGLMEFETRKGYSVFDLPLGNEETLLIV